MKLFIWDFHGTLEKGNEKVLVARCNSALEHFGYTERFTDEDIAKLYGKPWPDYFAYLLPNESPQRCEEMVQWCVDEADKDPWTIIGQYIEPTDYAHDVIGAIKQAGHDQILVSNSQKNSLDHYLTFVELKKYFPEDKIFPCDPGEQQPFIPKPKIAGEYVQKTNPDSVVVVGDSCKDITLLEGPNVISYLYSHPGKPFRDGCDPTYRINDLREILKEA